MTGRALLTLYHRVAPAAEASWQDSRALLWVAHFGNKQYYNGTDYAAGVVQINGVPSLAYVRLYDQILGTLIGQQWTNAAGEFRFELVAADRLVFCVAFDPLTGQNAEVYDRL